MIINKVWILMTLKFNGRLVDMATKMPIKYFKRICFPKVSENDIKSIVNL